MEQVKKNMLGNLFVKKHEQFVVATKYTLNTRPHDPNGGGNHRKISFNPSKKKLKNSFRPIILIYFGFMLGIS
ncbi:hypothetical protein GCM10020331_094940 [Ectobacillus funiculus]